MKKTFITIILISGILSLNACKGKADESTVGTSSTIEEPAIANQEIAPVGESKSYSVIATPESVTIGKEKEATVKIINLTAMQLSDPDGKITGIEISYEYEVTNNNKVGGSGIVMDPDKFRLVLDNGNKVSHEDYSSLSIDAESTKSMPGNKFKIPAGTKPVALNLFYNETSASVKLEMK